MPRPQCKSCTPLGGQPKAFVAIAMAWAAGFIDAAGWLILVRVYTSHMTGNTASLAFDFARGEWGEAARHAWPIAAFVAGLLYSTAVTQLARRRGVHSSFSIALFTELVLLGGAVALAATYGTGRALEEASPAAFYGMLSCVAAAMGIQTVTVTRVGGLRVYTTYLTGSLSKFAESVIRYCFWFYDRTRGRLRNRIGKVLAVTPRIRFAQHATLTGCLWMGFFAGAVCGIVSERRFRAAAFAFPMIVLAFATALDIIRPVAAADEPLERDSAH